MDFRSSPFVQPLRAAETDLLQLLLTDFSLSRSNRGSVLNIYFDNDSEAIVTRRAKNDLISRIPDFYATAERLQKRLDEFLIGQKGEELKISEPAFPFRYGSGGVLPILHFGENEYYCFFYRDVHPIGWNIANGGTDTRAELLNPVETINRELREELLIVDLKNELRYVFADDFGKSFDRPEFAVARQVWKELFPRFNFPNFKQVEIPIVWADGPDELIINTKDASPKTISPCYLNINALDFGIEIDRVAHININEDATLCDGEMIEGRPLNRVIGLFDVNEVNRMIRSEETSFRPHWIFHNANERSSTQLEQVIDDFITHARHMGIRSDADQEYFEAMPDTQRYDLCPVTRRIVQRYAGFRYTGQPYQSETGKEFKVFLSFAEEDEALARSVCEFVEEMGIPIFFSKRHPDPSFFDAIMDALESSNCLIAVATKPEHLTKEWPKFEWSSFSIMILSQKKRGAKMIPVISGFKPDGLPIPFLGFHAIEVEPQGLASALEELRALLLHCGTKG